MILKSQIVEVINRQQKDLVSKEVEIIRDALNQVRNIDGFATIVTGLRRCGKSTLLKQITNQCKNEKFLYLNFEDINLTGFETDDFKRLYAYITESEAKVLMFDEIQIVKNWEVFINQLLRERFKIYITGSNASMLSVDLGTHLTGRHISVELFPFSYSEFLRFNNKNRCYDSLLEYLNSGGMPEFLAYNDNRILFSLIEDILIRDIAIRHSVRNINQLKKLTIYLLTNISKPFSANRLSSVTDNLSTSTILEYIEYLRDAYIVDTIGQYSSNIRTTIRNPKKVYAIDSGLSKAITLSQSDDVGRLLENFVFVSLRKIHKNHLYYYKNRGECDFVVTDISNKPQSLYQVCAKLTDENFYREIYGLREAMEDLQISQGIIITLDTDDTINIETGVINIVKAYNYFD